MSAPDVTPLRTVSRENLRNIGKTLTWAARQWPDQIAVAEAPSQLTSHGREAYRTTTFRQLEDDTNRLAEALQRQGLVSGQRIVLMVRPSIDFVAFTFALFKAGAVIVLIDPGMGRRHMLACLEAVRPQGFVTVPVVHAIRALLPGRFPEARLFVTVGQRWWWGGVTADELRRQGSAVPTEGLPRNAQAEHIEQDAAIIFTTGSTGPPKGVRYTHGNFLAQVEQLQDFYGIAAGEVDIPCFPLFALFNAAMGVTTVIPHMDPTRPARVNPRHIVRAIHDWEATQAFASPALWNVVGRFCEQHGVQIPTLKRCLSAGAPVPPHVLARMLAAMSPDGDMHTPYGATESLPVASITGREVLGSTADQSAHGAGTCVGRHFPGIRWHVIRIRDDAISRFADAEMLPTGVIGELIVAGPVVTLDYVTRTDLNELAKIRDGETIWHRMGDVGYLDEADRFWFCGRKSHRVRTAGQTLFTIPCEAIANAHPRVYRSALVGIGPRNQQTPALVVECWPEHRVRSGRDKRQLRAEIHARLQDYPPTRCVDAARILFRRGLPVDIRHNAKIFREQLALWAARRL